MVYILFLYFKQVVNDKEYIILCFICVLFEGQFRSTYQNIKCVKPLTQQIHS